MVNTSEERKVFSLLADRPAKKDVLDFQSYAATLAGIIRGLDPSTPLTIGVFGDWGSGKTTLLRMVEQRLQAEGVATVWLNVWQLSNEDELWNAFLQAIVNKVRAETPWHRRLRFNARLLWRRVDWSALPRQIVLYGWRALVSAAPVALARLLPAEEDSQAVVLAGGGLASAALGLYLVARPFIEEVRQGVSVDFGGLLKTSPYQERITALDQFKEHFEDMVEALVGQKGRVVVFIDDLDRCPPERVVQVLDAIKLFVDIPRGVYVLGLDRDIIEQAVETKYKGYDDEEQEAREYLEKIIQLPFDLPPLTGDKMQTFVDGLAPDLPDERCAGVFALGLEPNPRKVKRTINIFLFFWELAQQRAEKLPDIKPVRLAKVVVIQHSHPDLYVVLRDFPGDLARLEEYFVQSERALAGQAAPGEEAAPAEIALPELSERLKAFQNIGVLRRLLTLHLDEEVQEDANFAGLPPGELRSYITLTRSVSAEIAEELPHKDYEPELVNVPAGPFRMGTSDEEIQWLVKNTDWAKKWAEKGGFDREQPAHQVDLPEYWIGRNPVTNAEYAAFVRAKEYAAPAHWEAGEYPPELSDHPVVNVSWHDAVAYCEWLSEVTGKPYRLPSEAEWEKAAGWDEKVGKRQRYPWGDDFDPEKCNTWEGRRGMTTPVGQYSPAGDSPYGASDMAGNVWEWCQDWFAPDYYQRSPSENPSGPEKGERRVMRGGSWYHNQGGARCAFRLRGDLPDVRLSNFGFRVAASSGSP